MPFCQSNKQSLLMRIKNDILEKVGTDAQFLRLYGLDPMQPELILKTVLEAICSADPTKTKGYSGWILESYLDGGIRSLEDLGRIRRGLTLFDRLLQTGQLDFSPNPRARENILKYCGLIGCQSNRTRRPAPFDTTQSKVLSRIRRAGLEDFLLPYEESECPLTLPKDNYVEDIIYEGKTVRVIRPTTEESAIYWGRNTRWCTAARDNNMFSEYYKPDDPLFILINRLNPTVKHQLHIGTKQYMDVRDRPVPIEKLMQMYPEIFTIDNKFKGPSFRPRLLESEDVLLLDQAIVKTEFHFPETFSDEERKYYFLNEAGDIDTFKFQNMPLEGLDLTGVKNLDFEEDFNKPIETLDLKNVKSLRFGFIFNQPIENLDLKNVESLIFGYNFNHLVEKLDLKSVRTLVLGDSFNQPIENLDLKGVESLTFGAHFNHPVENLDLKNVESLIFGYKFNQPVEKLDLKNVRTLKFGDNFNQPVEKLDLKNVQSLSFGRKYNHPIENLDLKNVRTLEFSYEFNQPVEKLDLKDVRTLKFGESFNQPIENLDLKNVQSLSFGMKYNQPIENLDLKNVRNLDLGDTFNHPVDNLVLKNVEKLSIPTSLLFKKLNLNKVHTLRVTLDLKSKQQLQDLDLRNVRTVILVGPGVYDTPHHLSINLKNVHTLKLVRFGRLWENLDLGNVHNLELDIIDLPELLDLKKVQRLKFGNQFNSSLTGLNLKNVKILKFGDAFNQSVEDLDLKNVEILKFGMTFNQPISNLKINNLRNLTLLPCQVKNVTNLPRSFFANLNYFKTTSPLILNYIDKLPESDITIKVSSCYQT